MDRNAARCDRDGWCAAAARWRRCCFARSLRSLLTHCWDRAPVRADAVSGVIASCGYDGRLVLTRLTDGAALFTFTLGGA
jgi:hypothetical protein